MWVVEFSSINISELTNWLDDKKLNKGTGTEMAGMIRGY